MKYLGKHCNLLLAFTSLFESIFHHSYKVSRIGILLNCWWVMLNRRTANNSSIHVRFKKHTSPDFFNKISQSVLKYGMLNTHVWWSLTSVFTVHPTICKFLLITNYWQIYLRIVAFALSNERIVRLNRTFTSSILYDLLLLIFLEFTCSS